MALKTGRNGADKRAKIMQGALSRHESPLALNRKETVAFDLITGSREYESWLDSDLQIAANLARVSVEMDRLWQDYMDTGDKEAFERYNKLFTPFQRMHNMLGLSSGQRPSVGRKVDQHARNQKQTAARRKASTVTSLIAKPS